MGTCEEPFLDVLNINILFQFNGLQMFAQATTHLGIAWDSRYKLSQERKWLDGRGVQDQAWKTLL